MTDRKKDIIEALRQAIAEVLEKDLEFTLSSKMRNDLNIQSIDIIEIVFLLEQKLHSKIDIVEYFQNQAQTGRFDMNDIVIGDLVDFIDSKLTA